MDPNLVTLLSLVAAAVFIIFQALAVPAFGTNRAEMNRIRKRVSQNVAAKRVEVDQVSLLRERFRRNETFLEKMVFSIPGFRRLTDSSGSSGNGNSVKLAYIGASFLLLVLGGLLAWNFTTNIWVSVIVALMLAWLPFQKLRMDQVKRFELFEQQLPDALEMITRALRSGYPFGDSLNVVSQELEDPIAEEFYQTFSDINGGVDVRVALLNLLERVPSVSLMAMVTTVVLQRETGGNLAETLQNISSVIRARFKFQRDVRILTAEGRISAWVMTLLPFGLFAFLYLSNRDYVSDLFEDPVGLKMIGTGLGLLVLGSLWLRKMINFEV